MSLQPVELTVSGKRAPDPGSARLVATLTVAAMLAGLVLSMVYQGTLPIIEANKKQALEAAVFEVVPGATRLERLVWQDEALTVGGGEAAVGGSVAFAAYDENDKLAGFALPGAGAGFQDTIELLFGVDPAVLQVTGMYILQSRETPGLGDKIFKDEAFVANFRDLQIEPEIRLVKDDPGQANEVDAITGATISSRAVVRIINETLSAWRPRLTGAALTGAALPAVPSAATTGERGDG